MKLDVLLFIACIGNVYYSVFSWELLFTSSSNLNNCFALALVFCAIRSTAMFKSCAKNEAIVAT